MKNYKIKEITVQNCKMIYKLPGYPVYLILEHSGKHFIKVKCNENNKDNELFKLMNVNEKTVEIPHNVFNNYIQQYNAYCIYIEDLWKVKGE